MRLEDYLHYDQRTGIIFNFVRNKRVDFLDKTKGYRKVFFFYKNYLAHRLAWYLYYGEWPEGRIDHINRDRSDNRLTNLREVSQRQNMQNAIHYNRGVTYEKSNSKWIAQIHIDGKNIKLGRFSSREDAQQAYINKLIDLDEKEVD